MKKNNILTSQTRSMALIGSIILLVLAAINVFLIMFFTPREILSVASILSIIPFSTSLMLMLIAFVFYGVVMIKVFIDYKKQNKTVCANGIIYISFVALSILIFGFVMATMASTSINSIYVYTVIFGLFAVWNVCYAIYGFKHKYKNAIFSIIYAVLEVLYAVFITLAIVALLNLYITVMAYIVVLSIISVALVIVCAIDLLVNYVLRTPDFLENEEVLKAHLIDETKKEEENQKIQARLAAFRGGFAQKEIKNVDVETAQAPVQQSDIETKLKKLEDLYNKKLITEDEYKEKKKKLIDEL